MKNVYTTIKKLILLIVPLSGIVACSDFVEVDPPKTETVSRIVFDSDGSANSAIIGVYSLMMTNQSFTWAGLEEYVGIASDELVNYATRIDQTQFYENSLTPKNGAVLGIFWAQPYKYINNANAILEGVALSSGMTAAGKREIEGQAKFVRAFCHFYLVNLFGEIPYIKTSDYKENSKAPRMGVDEVYQHIEADLLDSYDFLGDDYAFAKGERTVPNKAAAAALLARVYLYRGQWEKAAGMATTVIDNVDSYSLLTNLDAVFLANSKEAIWQLRPIIPGANTPQGQLFILRNPPNSFSSRVSMADGLFSAFEEGDLRKTKWTSTFSSGANSWNYVYKYKISGYNPAVSEYAMVLRLAEQYLIRAEARANLLNIDGAREDLNKIRERAGLAQTSAMDHDAIMLAIEQERRVELFGEYGHRWLDIKRTGRADALLASVKPQWQSTDALFPIPESERLLNPNLTQNPGY